MKESNSDLKVNRNKYPDAVPCDRMRLIGPKCDQLGPIRAVDCTVLIFEQLSTPLFLKDM